MTPVKVLKLALDKEKASIALYTKLSGKHKEIQDLLILLINEEEKHKKLIEENISRLQNS